ncbi:MAG: insulinase family protein, partial [Thermoplasmata archaeon]|nr:insulinase family protein [Thermoplasmata archaeon]
DIRSLTPADLAAYYHRFYGTRNAVLVVAGGFDAAGLRRDIRRQFGRLPSTGDDPTVKIVEPPPTGERRASLSGPGTTPFLDIGWRAPAVADPMAPATILLDVVLGGETRLFAAGSIWGRSPEHPSSRLYRRLVDPGLAVRATSEWRPRLHPGLFEVHAQAARGVPLERLEAAIFAETARLAASGPTAKELSEARTKIDRAVRLAYEGATRTAFRLGYFAMLGPPGFEERLLHQIRSTSVAQVRAAAEATFRPAGRTVVGYTPVGEAADG